MTTTDAPHLPGTCAQPPDLGAGDVVAPSGSPGVGGPVQRLADASVWLIFRLSGVRS